MPTKKSVNDVSRETDAGEALTSANDARAQRIDKWLWCARFFKTRSLASRFVAAAAMRVTRNGATQRIEKPSFLIRPGDEIVFSRNDHLRIVRIIDCAERRGPAKEAALLFEDRSPPPPARAEKHAPAPGRPKGAGRPTKKDRRR
ncbi:MAG: RNA-binding S4 domain-containing protein, partial [Pseudomonadota bacterium]